MPVNYDDCLFADRVLERTNTTGLDDFLCVGTRIGYRTFLEVFDEDDETIYLAEHETSGQWEIGKGTVGADGALTRDEIIESSASGAKVDFDEGQKLVRCTMPAELLEQFAGFALPVVDTQTLVKDPADGTKRVRIDAGAVGTGQTRVLSMPNRNVDLDFAVLADGSVPFTADQSLGGNQLTNVGDPVGDQDAATKAYVDDQLAANGDGDVVGPGSSTDNALTRFDGTTGKLIQNSAVTLDDNDKLKHKAAYETIVTATDGATVTLNCNLGNKFKVTLGGNRTLAFSNLSLNQCVMLRVIQDGTGTRTLTYPANVEFAGGAPTLSAAAGEADWLGFICIGTDGYGDPILDGFVLGLGYSR